ncbi:unnamed protein product [Ectocarpus sp. 12 AP-2014]
MADEQKSPMPESEGKSSGTSGPVSRNCDRGVEEAKGISADSDGPGHPSDESAAELPRLIPPQANSGEPPETLHSALVCACDENDPIQEGLTKTRVLETVLTGAVASKEAAMLEKVAACVTNTDNVTGEEAKKAIVNSFRDEESFEGLLANAARTGDSDIWEIVVKLAEVAEQDLLRKALEPRGCGRTVITAAVESEEPATVTTVVKFVRRSIPDAKVKTLLRASDDRRGTVLRLVAGHGNIGMWKAVVVVLTEEGLLEEVHTLEEMLTTTGNPYGTVLTAAVDSKQLAMVEEVVKCVKRNTSDQKAKSLMESGDYLTNRHVDEPAEVVREKGLHSTMLHAAAFSGNIGVWDAAVNAFKEGGLLDEVDTDRGRTVHHLCSRVGTAGPLNLSKFGSLA